MSYFYFFFNILVGLWAGLMSRVLKGAALGLIYLPRLDRTSMMRGHYTMDSGITNQQRKRKLRKRGRGFYLNFRAHFCKSKERKGRVTN
jgi:hypothetical protein